MKLLNLSSFHLSKALALRKYRKLIFVFGPARSGTTVLYRLTCGGIHHRVFSECTILTSIVSTMQRHSTATPERFEDYFACDAKMVGLYREHCVRIIDNLLRNEARKNILFLKDPQIIHTFDGYRRIFPEAFFLGIVRNPVEVLASRYTVSQKSKSDFNWPHEIERASLDFRKTLHIARKNQGDNRLALVRYGDLIKSPQDLIIGIERFIGEKIERKLEATIRSQNKSFITEKSHSAWLKGSGDPFLIIPREWRSDVNNKLQADVLAYEKTKLVLGMG